MVNWAFLLLVSYHGRAGLTNYQTFSAGHGRSPAVPGEYQQVWTEGGSDRLDGDTPVAPEPQQRRVPHPLPQSLHKRPGPSDPSPGETHCQGFPALEVWNVPPHVSCQL